jgi:hypothetical protein
MGVRRLLNVSPDLPDKEREELITQFDSKMRFSGYNKKFRWNVLDLAYSIYEGKLKDAEDGVRPLYRRREFNREEREKKNMSGRETWYRGNKLAPNLAPLKVDPTPGGKMFSEMEKVIKDFSNTHGIKLVERGGRKIATTVKSNRLGSGEYGREKCSFCAGEKDGLPKRHGTYL